MSYPSTVIADFVSEIPLSPLDDSGSEPEPAELDPVGRESLETLESTPFQWFMLVQSRSDVRVLEHVFMVN